MSCRIAIIVEGKTEKAFMPILRRFLENHLKDDMPKLKPVVEDGRVPKGDKLKRKVETLLSGADAFDHVIALTDVYTGNQDFDDGNDAIQKMNFWAGGEPRFHPHAAQHDFEAWLLPYWDKVKVLSKSNMAKPFGNPEDVNHGNPPAYRLKQAYRQGDTRKDYKKTVDAGKILAGEDLGVAVAACPHLKAFVNTIIHTICGKPAIP
ncbi:MAG: DUF4276 family protein [Candidatus Sumerlaeota bacterium]|nr:DUF4276 family protein [Candidatus Sumerlaeota bacterium]